jgi:hypothetical protein
VSKLGKDKREADIGFMKDETERSRSTRVAVVTFNRSEAAQGPRSDTELAPAIA